MFTPPPIKNTGFSARYRSSIALSIWLISMKSCGLREDLAETIKKAFIIAKTGKPGVAVVDLPKDIQKAYGSDAYPKETAIGGYSPHLHRHRIFADAPCNPDDIDFLKGILPDQLCGAA